VQGRRSSTSLHRTCTTTCHHLHRSSTNLLRLPLLVPYLRPRRHPQRLKLKIPGLLLLQLEGVVEGRHMQSLLHRLLRRLHTTPHHPTLVCQLQTALTTLLLPHLHLVTQARISTTRHRRQPQANQSCARGVLLLESRRWSRSCAMMAPLPTMSLHLLPPSSRAAVGVREDAGREGGVARGWCG